MPPAYRLTRPELRATVKVANTEQGLSIREISARIGPELRATVKVANTTPLRP